jgi:hypothetical protein
VLRAYGKGGNFDETRPQPLWLVYDTVEEPQPNDGEDGEFVPDPELYAAYGENGLSLHNITLSSGTVSVRGDGIPEDHEVYVAGRAVPVDESGSFVTEHILPEGAHTVEVAVVDGAGELYLRDLEFKENDWFYVGMADVTLAEGEASPAMELLQGENSPTDLNSSVDGRFAFFVNGKFGTDWKLTASADTREGPIDELFSNFMDKSPESLFRRIDPDYYYPTFGDDSTVAEMAPTMGKFYVRLANQDNHAQWGTCITSRSRPPASATSALQSTALPPSPAPWRAARSSAAPVARCTSCSARMCCRAPSGCASSSGTRPPG